MQRDWVKLHFQVYHLNECTCNELLSQGWCYELRGFYTVRVYFCYLEDKGHLTMDPLSPEVNGKNWGIRAAQLIEVESISQYHLLQF